MQIPKFFLHNQVNGVIHDQNQYMNTCITNCIKHVSQHKFCNCNEIQNLQLYISHLCLECYFKYSVYLNSLCFKKVSNVSIKCPFFHSICFTSHPFDCVVDGHNLLINNLIDYFNKWWAKPKVGTEMNG